MKTQIAMILALALAAGSASAQGTFGPKPKQTWNSDGSTGQRKPSSSYGVPTPPTVGAPRAPATPKTYGAPEAPTSPGFKPYEGYKSKPGSSIFGPDGKPRR